MKEFLFFIAHVFKALAEPDPIEDSQHGIDQGLTV
jgi:hypothetical protein